MNNKFKLFTTTSGMIFSEEISRLLSKPLGKIINKKFSCGEIYINYEETIRGHDVFIISTIRPEFIHDDFFEIFLMCDAARRSFAKSITVSIAHFGYSRQDKIHSSREPISMKLCADLIVKSGVDKVITMNLHADQSQAFFDVPVDNLSPKKIFVDYFKSKKLEDIVIVSPDAGGAKNAKKFADMINADLAILHKNRSSHNNSEVTHVIGNIKNKTPIIFDDIIDTAGSVCNAKQAILNAGCKNQVFLAATHPVFSGPAIERLNDANFTEIVTTNSIHIQNPPKNFKQIKIDGLIANVIKNTMEEKSVSVLY